MDTDIMDFNCKFFLYNIIYSLFVVLSSVLKW